ncbi:MAG: OmpA family protein, partial [Burkholderiales bacterium]|nr:OmpA family protein [Burkholderiales bacterium]
MKLIEGGLLAAVRRRFEARQAPPFRRTILFEALEQRLLLSADGATPLAVDAIAVARQGEDPLQALLAEASAAPVQFDGIVDAVADAAIDLAGAAAPSAAADASAGTWIIDLDAGARALRAGDGDNVWRITGPDEGTLNDIPFADIGVLLGGAGNEDLFYFEPGGTLSGYLDGGPGGFDTLVIDGGSYADTRYEATGPDSGFIHLDGNLIRYLGLEPVANTGSSVSAVYGATGGADVVAIGAGALAGQILIDSVNGTFEDTTIAEPSQRLRLDAGAGDDVIQFNLESFAAQIVIDGGAGTDTLDLSGRATPAAVLRFSDGTAAVVDGARFVRVLGVENFSGAVVLTEQGVPQWLEQGPGVIHNGQPRGIANQPVAGAVQAIAVHPFDPNVIYVGTAAGGIWRSGDRSVLFETADFALDLDDQGILDEYALFLRRHPDLEVRVVGHTDDVGSSASNLTLSQQRANSVRDHLIAQGVDGARISVSFSGENDPVATNATESGRALNRRVELLTGFWEPLTDQFPSLAIGDITLSAFDEGGLEVTAATPLGQLVLFAGTGKFSNSGDGGSNIGVLKSTDGGATWALVGAPEIAGLPVTSVEPGASSTVLVSALDKAEIRLQANGRASFTRDGTLVTDVVRDGGVLRSADEGLTWTNLSEAGGTGLPEGGASDLVPDPSDPDRFYAAVLGQGVFRSEDEGASWIDATGNLPFVSDASRIVLSVSGAEDGGTGNHPIYAATIHRRAAILGAEAGSPNANQAGQNLIRVDRPDIYERGDGILIANVDVSGAGDFDIGEWEQLTVQAINRATGVLTLSGNLANAHAAGRLVVAAANIERVSGIFRSGDLGATWTKMGFAGDVDGTLNPGNQAGKNFALLADRDNANIVYASGDRQPGPAAGGNPGSGNPNAAGAINFTGRIFRGTFAPGGSTWTPVTDTNAGNTAPHADSRELVFDAAGNVLEGDDGGIYRLRSPSTAERVWESKIGTLRATEVRSLAYDPVNNIIGTGNQDTGSSIQPAGLADPVDTDGDGVPDDQAARFVWLQTQDTFNGGAGTSRFTGDGNTQALIATTAVNDQRDNDSDGQVDEADESAFGARVIRFSMGNTWTTFIREEFDATGARVTPLPTLQGGVFTNSFGGPMRDTGNGVTFDQQVGLRAIPTDPVFSGLTNTDRRAGFTTLPVAVNAADSLFMMTGLNSLYESSDRLETVTEVQPKPGVANISAIAYGGMNRMSGSPLLGFADANPDTITRSAGSWVEEGFLSGQRITVSGAGANDGSYAIANVTATELRLSNSANLTAAANVAGASVTAPNVGVTMLARFNQVFVRTGDVFDNAFVAHTVDGATQIRDLVFDLDDWRTAYAVDRDHVFRSTDGGAHWEVISAKLAAPNLQTLEMVRTESGVKALLVGTELGVFRTLDPLPEAIWTEFGRGLPNALAR